MTHAIQNRRLVPIDDALQELGGIGRTTLYRLIRKGLVVRINIGSRAFITGNSIAAYLDSLTSGY